MRQTTGINHLNVREIANMKCDSIQCKDRTHTDTYFVSRVIHVENLNENE